MNGVKTLSAVLLVITLLSAQHWVKLQLRSPQYLAVESADQKPLYLPDARYVRLITLGFDNFASHVLWFSTLSYFGKQLRGKRDFRWLGDMCDTVTELNPKSQYVYEFCGTMLSWLAKDPQASNKILTKGIATDPHYWRYRYQRGFNHWYFFGDQAAAKKDLSMAAKLPGAPAFVASQASRLIAGQEDPETAIRFLTSLLKSSNDKATKAALTKQLKNAFLSKDLKTLKKALDIYHNRFGTPATSLEQLTTAGIINSLPKDPFGGQYFIDSTSGELATTSGKKGLRFFGKTAEEKMNGNSRS